MQIVSSIVKFAKNLYTDGYKLISILSPTYAFCKYLGVLDCLQELSYAWAFLPLLAWVFTAYVRRWNAYCALEAKAEVKEPQIYNFNQCSFYFNSDSINLVRTSKTIATQPVHNNIGSTYAIFKLESTIIVEDCNNISTATDNCIGNFSFDFIEPIKNNYFVDVKLDKVAEYEIYSKTHSGFAIAFNDSDPAGGKIINNES